MLASDVKLFKLCMVDPKLTIALFVPPYDAATQRFLLLSISRKRKISLHQGRACDGYTSLVTSKTVRNEKDGESGVSHPDDAPVGLSSYYRLFPSVAYIHKLQPSDVRASAVLHHHSTQRRLSYLTSLLLCTFPQLPSHNPSST